MKKTMLSIFLIISMALLLIPSPEASPIIDLGTILYKGSISSVITQAYDVTLIEISIPIPDSIICQKLGFNSILNQTYYLFSSTTFPIDYTFENNTKTYLFQDTISNQLYKISIDFTGYQVPQNPWIGLYNNTIHRYNNILGNYTILNASLNNITIRLNGTIDELNSTIDQLVGMSLNESLAQNMVNSLRRDKIALKDEVTRTQILMILLCIFVAVIVIFLGRKFGLFNKNIYSDRKKKNLDSGYGPVLKDVDGFIVENNDNITRGKKQQKTRELSVEKLDKQTQSNIDIDLKFEEKLLPINERLDKLIASFEQNTSPEKRIQKTDKKKKKGSWWETPAGIERKKVMSGQGTKKE